ncbi:hypothetical protein [Microlunatus ginsengisoli]|uniref:Uncharacterized protein n=1 Tax=Microlunatus ginsengisoli TaxID=363863 RepID=A0ABP7AUM0_9ACTN
MPSETSSDPRDERDQQPVSTNDYDPDEDQDTESTNTAPVGERPIDPEQAD